MATQAHPLVRRLDGLHPLAAGEKEALAAATSDVRIYPAQSDLIKEGDQPTHIHVVVEGFACRYKLVDGGKRQIVSYIVPGDICDPHLFLLDVVDHGVLTLAESKIAMISRSSIRALLDNHPAITRAFLCSALVDESVSREWLANMGRRSPDKRIGHLLCEMLTRLQSVGLAENDRFAFPITQADLGDTMGLSTVHVNRTLQNLKEKRLIASKRGVFEILDVARLCEFSDFQPSYLCFAKEKQKDAASGLKGIRGHNLESQASI